MPTEEFPLDSDICYLNHAAVAPWPSRTRLAVCRFAEENTTRGACRYPEWLRTEAQLRQRLARMLNAEAQDIALVKNTSEGLSFVAYGLEWSPGDRIVGIKGDFPSNRVPWLSLADQGVEFDEVDLRGVAEPEQVLLTACGPRTRMLAVSSVDYATGFRLDLARLGAHCRRHNMLLCVDAIQSIGAVRFDVGAIGADFVAADGHKWMLGPEGLGVFWVRPALRERLRLTQFGWHMLAERGDYDNPDWRPRDDASRFECGSPNMLGVHALEASLSLLEEIGMAEVERRLLANTGLLAELLEALPDIELLTPRPPPAGIVTFRHRRIAPDPLHRALSERGVICAARGGGIRFSPHFHTPSATLHNAVEILSNLQK